MALFALAQPEPEQLTEVCWTLVDDVVARQAQDAERKAVRKAINAAYPFGKKEGATWKVSQSVVRRALYLRFTGL